MKTGGIVLLASGAFHLRRSGALLMESTEGFACCLN